MPRFDGTGPQGMGPRSGRGFGPCGFGMGWMQSRKGRGFGRYFGLDQPQTREEKLSALSDYRKALEEELADVKEEEAKLV